MPYKYIGRKHNFKGKSLWEIVGNLKKFGVGRIVIRNMFERYPEKSYMRILKVETLPNPEKPSMDNSRLVKVWLQNTFRGKTYPEPVLIEHTSYKTDFQLIPKDEEHKYLKSSVYEYEKILPKTMEFPPLLKELIIRNAKAKGEKLTEDPKLDIFYNKSSVNANYKIADGSEKPTVEIDVGLGKPVSPGLYKGIKL